MRNQLCALAAVLMLVCVAMSAPSKAATSAGAAAIDGSYVLQRRYDSDAKWTNVVTFGIDLAKLRIKPNTNKAQQALTPAAVKLLGEASVLHYRVISATSSGDDETVVLAGAVSSACSLIRGFEASTTMLTLPEAVNVVLGLDGVITGLQLSSKATSACDKSVLSLFPSVTISTTVGLYKPFEPRGAENVVADQAHLIHPSGFPLAATALPKQQQQQQNPQGGAAGAEGGDNGPKEDNRSFFEKYQMYILMFVAYTAVNAYFAPKAKEGAAAAAK